MVVAVCVLLFLYYACSGFCSYHMVVTSTLRTVTYVIVLVASVSLLVVFHLHCTYVRTRVVLRKTRGSECLLVVVVLSLSFAVRDH